MNSKEKPEFGFLRGTFKLLHPGHIKLISNCSMMVSKLFILIDSDKRLEKLGKEIFFSEQDRVEMLLALKGVENVYIFDDEDSFERRIVNVRQIYNSYGAFLYFKGGDYSLRELPEKASIERKGGIVCCVGFSEGHSTSKLVAKIRGEDRKENLQADYRSSAFPKEEDNPLSKRSMGM